MGTGIGEEHRESVREQKLRVSRHAEAVVADSVKKQDGIAIGLRRPNEPTAQNRRVGSCDGDVLYNGVKRLNRLTKCRRVVGCEAAARRMQRPIGKNDTANGTESEIQQEREDEPAEAAVSGHMLSEDTT